MNHCILNYGSGQVKLNEVIYMELRKVFIENYKHLKNFTVEFHRHDNVLGNASLKFFIGRNGSGKSALLEAIGLIFTRIFYDESPGFNFEIEYSIKTDSHYACVSVGLNNEKLDIFQNENDMNQLINKNRHRLKVKVTHENGTEEEFNSFCTLKKEYQPEKIVVYSSGPNSIMNEILVTSPKTSLYSDIYDASESIPSNKSIKVRENEIQNSLQHLRNIVNNPKCIFIDGETAKLVLIVLFAVVPGKVGQGQLTEQQKTYCRLRDELIKYISKRYEPIGFSLVVDEKRLGEIKKNSMNNNTQGFSKSHASFMELIYSKKEATEVFGECLNDWVVERNIYSTVISTEHEFSQSNLDREIIATFNMVNENSNEQMFYHVPKLNERWNPLSLLTILLSAKSDGLLKDAHIAFKHNDCEEILYETALSDGEYLWLARMGLVLIAQDPSMNNSLFLFDEPDVHLNESWNVDFVKLIHKFISLSDEEVMNHEFIIATHSSLILTDADPEQVYHFDNKNGRVELKYDDMSTFAANRGDISQKIFGTKSSIGGYSSGLIEEKIKFAQKSEELKEILCKVGPGYLRFRLLERFFELKRSEKSQEGREFNASKD